MSPWFCVVAARSGPGRATRGAAVRLVSVWSVMGDGGAGALKASTD